MSLKASLIRTYVHFRTGVLIKSTKLITVFENFNRLSSPLYLITLKLGLILLFIADSNYEFCVKKKNNTLEL
ncbi:MAG: hypothetical protein Ct9H90mP2_10210 [Dehalococcoidia bacterium]|nr:MAG: hypothetical protein Ct9H90mP2_10210 [Dehalococcoidia bacterium]